MTSKSLSRAALAACALAFVFDVFGMGISSFLLRPQSDEAAGVLFIGAGLAMLADVAALVLAIIALVAGRREQAPSMVGAILALVAAIFGMALIPFVAIFWILLMSPIGIH